MPAQRLEIPLSVTARIRRHRRRGARDARRPAASDSGARTPSTTCPSSRDRRFDRATASISRRPSRPRSRGPISDQHSGHGRRASPCSQGRHARQCPGRNDHRAVCRLRSQLVSVRNPDATDGGSRIEEAVVSRPISMRRCRHRWVAGTGALADALALPGDHSERADPYLHHAQTGSPLTVQPAAAVVGDGRTPPSS